MSVLQFDPSQPLRTVPPPDAASGKSRAQIELQRMRAAVVASDKREHGDDDDTLLCAFRVRREEYDMRWEDNTNGYIPDPQRRVASHWKLLRSDRRGGVTYKQDGQLANPAEFAADFGPFKVRWLRGPKAGAVEDLSAEQYHNARAMFFGGRSMASCEPVPDDEPLCPPARPANMPSSFAKAQAIAGKALQRNPAELTFAECVAYFSTRPPGLFARR